MCVWVCERARLRRNAALECGRGHRRGLPALGVMAAASFVWCWVALRPTSGRGLDQPGSWPARTWKGGRSGHLVPAGLPSAGFLVSARFPQAWRCSPGGRVSGVESFVTQNFRGGMGGGGEGVKGRCLRGGAGLWAQENTGAAPGIHWRFSLWPRVFLGYGYHGL